jgi:hypothetical protein
LGGQGVTSALLDSLDNPGNEKWVRDRLGISHGLSNCATQSLIMPLAEAPRLSIWAALCETGGDGLDFGANGWSQGQWMGATNWSANRDRWFWLIATDGINPRSGAKLDRVYNT